MLQPSPKIVLRQHSILKILCTFLHTITVDILEVYKLKLVLLSISKNVKT